MMIMIAVLIFVWAFVAIGLLFGGVNDGDFDWVDGLIALGWPLLMIVGAGTAFVDAFRRWWRR